MKSLLIIDDDEDMGEALLALLAGEGHRVRLASSGKAGIEMALADPPDVILLDWQMPEMGGEQVLVALAPDASLAKVPVILMSANIATIPEVWIKSRKHLRKPFDVEALVALVTEVIKPLGPN